MRTRRELLAFLQDLPNIGPIYIREVDNLIEVVVTSRGHELCALKFPNEPSWLDEETEDVRTTDWFNDLWGYVIRNWVHNVRVHVDTQRGIEYY